MYNILGFDQYLFTMFNYLLKFIYKYVYVKYSILNVWLCFMLYYILYIYIFQREAEEGKLMNK